ncbi:MAG: DUF1302 domain-containing protein, partial [Zoogloea sp.]|nr:DUF1302 domain-containing protein [Zoogloea sp.]
MHANHHPVRRRPFAGRPRTLALAILAGLPAGTALAATDFTLGDAKGTFKADVTLGTQFRASPADPQLVNDVNARTVGLSGNPNGTTARNNDDGDLNFRKGDRTSTVLKTLAEVQLKGETLEGVVKAKAWHDFTLDSTAVPYGNIPDHYAAGAPLGDNGLSREARFSGVSLLDAYLKANFAFGGSSGDARIGNQVLQGWGERFGLGGGLSGVSPRDFAAATRPGALAGEIPVPMPMLQAKLGGAGLGSLEGFLVLHNRHNELPACGTFFSTADFVAEGCDKVYTGAGTDLSRDAAGTYMKRADDQGGSNRGQFGLAYRWQAESLNTRFSLNYANYSSRSPVIGVVKSTDPTTPVRPGDPSGSNAQYFTEYVDKVRVFGLGFESRLGATTLLGEVSYRPNQPIGLNGSDILNAFASYAAASELRADATATAAGADFHGYDQFHVWQGQLALTHPVTGVLGAQELTLSGEAALRHVDGLPDASVRRYGRSTVFGLGPVAGACSGDAIQCSSAGYVTSNAWGYRLKAALRYTGALPGVDLTPTLGFG